MMRYKIITKIIRLLPQNQETWVVELQHGKQVLIKGDHAFNNNNSNNSDTNNNKNTCRLD